MTNDDFEQATKRIASGDGDEAAAWCVRLWLAEHDESDALALTRTLLPRLFARHPAARAAFTPLRDECSSRLDDAPTRRRWLQLNEALGDGATVLRWLEDCAPGSAAAWLVAFDPHLQKLVEDAAAWPSLARHVELAQAEAHARQFAEALGKAVSRDELEQSLRFGLTAQLRVPKKALLAVGRREEAERLGALVERFTSSARRG